MKDRLALVGFGHSVKEIEITGMKPLLKKTVFRHYKMYHRYGPELLVIEEDTEEAATAPESREVVGS